MPGEPGLADIGKSRPGEWKPERSFWGDNKQILSSLKNGPMREEIEKQGGINF